MFTYYLYHMVQEIAIAGKDVRASDEACCGENHQERLLAIADAMDILTGKWKIQLIGILLFKGKMRFGELQRHISGIGAKMLSKELQHLEENKIVSRTVLQTKPITVEYEITSYGRSLERIVSSIVDWGMEHRREIMHEAG